MLVRLLSTSPHCCLEMCWRSFLLCVDLRLSCPTYLPPFTGNEAIVEPVYPLSRSVEGRGGIGRTPEEAQPTELY